MDILNDLMKKELKLKELKKKELNLSEKIIVYIPYLKTTMEINKKDFNKEWMIR